ncbi:MAG: replication factor C large subunit [Candidatus Heimdallarchaeota archaeon]
MWVQKYAPTRRSEIVGNEKSVNSIVVYLNRFRNPSLREKLEKRALLLYGPPGIGKTSSILAIATALNFDVVMVNASDKRNKKSLKAIRQASSSRSLKEDLEAKIGQILLIDEIDGLSGTADRGGIREIIEIIEHTRVPIILTANDVSPQKFKSLLRHCELREFENPSPQEIARILRRIADAELIQASDEVLLDIIEKSQNDIRGSINSFQTIASERNQITQEDIGVLSFRDQMVATKEFLDTIFIARNGDKAHELTRQLSDMTYSKLLLILRDLAVDYLPRNSYTAIAKIYDILAVADLALTRAQRHRFWTQLSYFYNFITRNLASFVPSHENSPTFPDFRLQVPQYWILLSRLRRKRKIALKVAKVCNVSEKDALNIYLPYIKVIFENNAEMAAHLALDFGFFDITPGKRRTRIVWNGEIDHLCKRKETNREIKKIIRTLYPSVERVIRREIDPSILQQLTSQQEISELKPGNVQKTESVDRNHLSTDIKDLENSKTPILHENRKKKKKRVKKKEKSLTDFF